MWLGVLLGMLGLGCSRAPVSGDDGGHGADDDVASDDDSSATPDDDSVDDDDTVGADDDSHLNQPDDMTGTLVTDRADAVLLGVEPGGVAGWSVAGLGDVNGDGVPDIAIGDPGYTDTPGSAGGVYIVYGPVAAGTQMLSEVADVVLYGTEYYSGMGDVVSGVGDVDGNGVDDVAIGEPWRDVARVYLFLGPVAEEVMDVAMAHVTYVGEQEDDYLGESISGPGDVNGDGLDDLVAAAAGYFLDGVGGRGYVGMNLPMQGTVQLPDVDTVIDSVTFAGGKADLDGDGCDDLLVGHHGDVYSLLCPISLGLYNAATADVAFIGSELASASTVDAGGDVDGDGFEDIVMTSAQGVNDLGMRGYVRVFFGPGSPGIYDIADADVVLYGENDDAGSAPYEVSSAGDFNGDGYGDFLVSHLGYFSGRGKVYLILGPLHAGSYGLDDAALDGGWYGEFQSALGTGVAGTGDLNLDGFDDFIVGAGGYTTTEFGNRVYVFFGRPS